MTDRDDRIANLKTLINLLADIEREVEASSLQGAAFLVELRELRQQCNLELALLEKHKAEAPRNND